MRRKDKLLAIIRATKTLNENYVSENLPIIKKGDELDTPNYINFAKFLEITDGVGRRPEIYCRDGFVMSVQGSYYNYSEPQDSRGPYESMEIGFPSQADDLIIDYAEDPEIPTQTVYPYVPVDIIAKLVDKHGGIDVVKVKEVNDKNKSMFNRKQN